MLHEPSANAIHYSLALAYRGLGDLEKAQTHMQQRGDQHAAIADPLLDSLAELKVGARRHASRGVAAGKSGDLVRAVAELQAAVEAAPNSHSARINLATALALSGEIDAAIDQLQHALRLQSASPQAHCNLAVLLEQRTDYDGALHHFRQAIQCDPQYSDAHWGLANLLAKTGDHERAVPHYERVVEIDPRHGAARLRQIVALSRAGRHQEAYQKLQETREVLPESTAVYQRIGPVPSRVSGSDTPRWRAGSAAGTVGVQDPQQSATCGNGCHGLRRTGRLRGSDPLAERVSPGRRTVRTG